MILGRFSPATYASSALHQVLLGPVNSELLVDLTVLAGLSIVIFWIVERTMQWRRDERALEAVSLVSLLVSRLAYIAQKVVS